MRSRDRTLFVKRRRRVSTKGKDRRPSHNGEYACKRWSGWLYTSTDGQRPKKQPLSCGTYACSKCAEAKQKFLSGSIYHAFLRRGGKAGFLTFTFPTKKVTVSWDSYYKQQTLSWENYIDYLPTFDSYHHISGSRLDKLSRALVANHGVATLPGYRNLWALEYWCKYIGWIWSKLRKRYARQFNQTFTYLTTIEYTKQKIPHLHTFQALDGIDSKTAHRFLVDQWLDLVPGSRRQAQDTELIQGNEQHRINYVLKYITKGFDERRIPPRAWEDHRVRRYRTSTNWNRPIIGSIASMELTDGTEFNRKAYERFYGRLYYYESHGKHPPPALAAEAWEWMRRKRLRRTEYEFISRMKQPSGDDTAKEESTFAQFLDGEVKIHKPRSY